MIFADLFEYIFTTDLFLINVAAAVSLRKEPSFRGDWRECLEGHDI